MKPIRNTGTGFSGTWWEQLPARLESELRELDALGIRYERDSVAEAARVLRLRLFVPLSEELIALIATFPDSYPYFAVQVEAPTLDLAHHQHPFGKALCLLPRSTWWWNPASDGLARLLKERLRTVIDAGSSMDWADSAEIEEHTPEPFSDYYPYAANSLVLIAAGEDGRERVAESVACGTVVLGVEGGSRGALPNPLLRSALIEVRGPSGEVLMNAPDALASKYPLRIEGRWSRLPSPVRGMTLSDAPEAVYRAGEARDQKGSHLKEYETEQSGQRMRVRAVLYPEEHRWRGVPDHIGDGWVFAVRLQQGPGFRTPSKNSRISRQTRGARGEQPPSRTLFYLARPGRYAPGDIAARAPELLPLRDRAVAIFGLGCLGAPSAFEFARASVGNLNLLDNDVVDPPTTMRWPLGILVAGMEKAPVIAQILGTQYPYVNVTAEVHRIGAPRAVSPNGTFAEPESAILDRMLDGVDLLYDATAEWGVQRFLAGVAADRKIPYVGVQGTPGGWGGSVVRILPSKTNGCWVCLQHWRSEPSERGGISAPPYDSLKGDIHPEGCADPTFAGANVDLAEVALMGVRTGVATLASGQPGAYPAASWDVAVLALRDSSGALIPPTWKTYRLLRHPACEACAGRGSHPKDADT